MISERVSDLYKYTGTFSCQHFWSYVAYRLQVNNRNRRSTIKSTEEIFQKIETHFMEFLNTLIAKIRANNKPIQNIWVFREVLIYT